jgi:hypothetical protein
VPNPPLQKPHKKGRKKKIHPSMGLAVLQKTSRAKSHPLLPFVCAAGWERAQNHVLHGLQAKRKMMWNFLRDHLPTAEEIEEENQYCVTSKDAEGSVIHFLVRKKREPEKQDETTNDRSGR